MSAPARRRSLLPALLLGAGLALVLLGGARLWTGGDLLALVRTPTPTPHR